MKRSREEMKPRKADKKKMNERKNLYNYETESDESSNEENKENLLKTVENKNNLKKDYKNIALLMVLYLLQGLPLGLNSSLPYILSSRKVSYADQGTFSFAFWPFSMKLLWAPLVDAIFIKRFGRRKSWLIPVQYLIGIFMFTFSDYVHDLLESNRHESTASPNGMKILIFSVK